MRKLALTIVLAGFGVAGAGCGGSGTPAVAKLGTTTATSPTTTTPSSNQLPGSSGTQANGGPGGRGGGGKVGVSFSVAGSVQQMTKFAACMRANGEPSFPDPNAQGVISAGSLNRGSPQFEQALQVCRKDMPGGIQSPTQQAQDLRQAIAFSDCMRQNGEPDYPDPQKGSGGGMVIHLGSGIDPSSPQFQRAQAICQEKAPGGAKG